MKNRYRVRVSPYHGNALFIGERIYLTKYQAVKAAKEKFESDCFWRKNGAGAGIRYKETSAGIVTEFGTEYRAERF